MSCRFYSDRPSAYGSCAAKKEMVGIEAGRRVRYEQDGYVSYNEYRTYDCNSCNSKKENCPYYKKFK